MDLKIGDRVEVYWGKDVPPAFRGTTSVTEVFFVDGPIISVYSCGNFGWKATTQNPNADRTASGWYVNLLATDKDSTRVVAVVEQAQMTGTTVGPSPLLSGEISEQGKWLSGIDRYRGETGGPSGLKWL